jgi:hypothetical protein
MNPAQSQQYILDVMNNRTIDHPTKIQEYEDGKFNPNFAFLMRDDELVCVWVGNVKKNKDGEQTEQVIREIGNSRIKKGFTAKYWSSLVSWIHPHIKHIERLI